MRWRAVVQHTGNRAGLLLCGDLKTATRLVLKNGAPALDLPPEELRALAKTNEALRELLRFAISEDYFVLREKLGTAIATRRPHRKGPRPFRSIAQPRRAAGAGARGDHEGREAADAGERARALGALTSGAASRRRTIALASGAGLRSDADRHGICRCSTRASSALTSFWKSTSPRMSRPSASDRLTSAAARISISSSLIFLSLSPAPVSP